MLCCLLATLLSLPATADGALSATAGISQEARQGNRGGDSDADIGSGFCDDGTVKDDGDPDTGWGFVPSVERGIYVQRFEPSDLISRDLDKVCLCWIRTRPDPDLDFDIVLFGHNSEEEQPENQPLAALPVLAEGVPEGIVGQFYCYDVQGAGFRAPAGPFYLGARWNASANRFFFLCADTDPTTPIVDTFFSFKDGEEWESVLVSNDPIFDEYRATMVRFVAAAGPRGIPTLGFTSLLALVALLLGGALLTLRRR